MARSYKLRAKTDAPATYEPDQLGEVLSAVRGPEIDDTEDDPFLYDYRPRCEKAPDGFELTTGGCGKKLHSPGASLSEPREEGRRL